MECVQKDADNLVNAIKVIIKFVAIRRKKGWGLPTAADQALKIMQHDKEQQCTIALK